MNRLEKVQRYSRKTNFAATSFHPAANRASRWIAASVAVVVWAVSLPAGAAQLWWNGTGTTWNVNTDWSTTSGGGSPPASPPGSADTAIFNITSLTTAQNITLDFSQAALGLQFNSAGGVSISPGAGGTLSIGTGGIVDSSGTNSISANVSLDPTLAETWTNNSTGTLTVSGSVTDGAGLFTVAGTGSTTISGSISGGTGGLTTTASTLTLSGASNTYSGPTTVSSGILKYGAAGAMSPNSAITVANNAQIVVTAGGTYAPTSISLTGSAGSSLNPAASAGALLFNVNGGSFTLNSPIAFSTTTLAEITAKGTGSTVNLTGQITGGLSTKTYYFGGGGTSTSNSHTIVISNAGNSYAGSTEIIGGQANITLQLSGGGHLPSTTKLFLAGDNINNTAFKAAFDLNGNNQTLTSLGLGGTGTNAGTQTAAVAFGDNHIGNSSATLGTLTLTASTSFPGVIGGGPGDNLAMAFTPATTGAFLMTGANTYSGGTTLGNGVTYQAQSGVVQTTTATLTSGSATVTVTPAMALTLALGESVSAPDLPAGTTIVNFGLTSGVKNGTLTLSKPASASNSDTLTFAAWDAVGSPNGPMSINGNGKFDMDGLSHAIGSLSSASSTSQVTSSAAGAVTLTIGGVSGSGTFAGTLQNGTGTVGVTKVGTGGEILSGTYTYSGPTLIDGGMLGFGGAAALPANSNVNMNGGDLGLASGNFTANLGTGNGQLQFTGSGGFAAVNADRTVNIGGSLAQLVWASTANFLPDGATLILSNSAATNTVDFQNPLDLNGATRTIQVDRGSAAVDAKISGVISSTGVGGITKTGAGILQLNAVNTFTGGLTVNGGTVRPGPSGNLGDPSGVLTVNDNGTVDLNGTSQSVSMLNGGNTGVITNSATGTGTLTVTNGGMFTGAINDGGPTKKLVINVPSSNLTLAGAGNAVGGVTVAAPAQLTLSQSNGNSPAGAGPITLNGGKLSLTGGGAVQGLVFNGYNHGSGFASPDPDYATLTTVNNHFFTLTPAATAISTASGKQDFDFSNYGPGTGAAFGTVGTQSANYGFTSTTNLEVTFTGYINVTQTGTATFQTSSDDASMVFIDNRDTPVVSQPNQQGFTALSGTYNFTTTGPHPITIVFNQGGGPYGLLVQWAGNGHGMQTLLNSEVQTAVTLAGSYPNALVVSGSGTVDIANSLNVTMGALSMNGTLNLTSGDSSGSSYSLTVGPTTLVSNPTFNITNSTGNGAGTLVLGAVDDGGVARTINVGGGGTVQFNANATHLGVNTIVNINDGKVVSNSATALGSTAQINLNTPTSVFTAAASQTISSISGTTGTVRVGGGATLTVGSTDNLSSTVSVPVTGAGALGKSGTGTMTLVSANSYGGGTVVNNGLLVSPTTLSLGAGPVTLSGGTLRVSGSTGGASSASVTNFGGTSTDVNGGGTPWVVNNTTITSNPINSDVLTLTDNIGNEARTAFFNTPQPFAAGPYGFKASFRYTMPSGGNPADGAAFTIQNDPRGTAALGAAGGGLGYTGITPSLATEINVYNGHQRGTNVVTNGATGTYLDTTPVNFDFGVVVGGDPLDVTLTYAPGSQSITEVVKDTVTLATYSKVFPNIDLQSLLGSSTGFIGFTGGTGGLQCTQTISNFSYQLVVPPADSYSNNVIVTGGATATIDVATTSPGETITMGNLSAGAGAGTTLNVTATTAPANAAYGLTLANGGTLAGNIALHVANNGTGTGTLTLGALGGAGGISATGPGIVVLAAANTYSGPTTVASGGTIKLVDASGTSSNNIPSSTLVNVAAGGKLDVTGLMNGTFAVASGQTLSGGGTVTGAVTAGAGGAIGGASGSTLTINGAVALQDQSHSKFSLGTPNGSGHPLTSLVNITGGNAFTVTGTDIVDLSGAAALGTYELYAFTSGTPTAGQFMLGTNTAGSFTYTFSVVPNAEVDLVVSAAATNGSAGWNLNSASNYGSAANWSPQQIPNGAGFTATFGNGASNSVTAGSLTVTVDSPVTVGSLIFNNTNGTDYTLGNGSDITLNNNGSGAAVTVNGSGGTGGRTTTISSNVLLSENTAIDVATNNTLQVTGKVTVAAGKTLTKSSPGTAVVTQAPALGNNSKLQVSAGNLRIAATTGTVSVGSGVTAAVSGTGTLELAGSLSALGTATVANRVNISNSSTATAGVLVSAGNQQVGGIDGTGNVQVSGGNLTTNHITAGALVIGGTSTTGVTVTIDASNTSGNPTADAGSFALQSVGSSSLLPNSIVGAPSLSSLNGTLGGSGLGSLSLGTASLSGSASSVPEPSTIVLVIGAGLIALSARRRGVRSVK